MPKKYDKDKARKKRHIHGLTSALITNLKTEMPELVIDLVYSSSSGLSSYVCTLIDGRSYVIRISNHTTDKVNDFNYSVMSKFGKPFKMCSTVMKIVNHIKKFSKENSEKENKNESGDQRDGNAESNIQAE